MMHPDRSKRRAGGVVARAAAGTLALVGALSIGPGPVAGQSLLAARGLGVPSEALDARSRALGSVGVGLPDWRLLPTDPAGAAGLSIPSISVSYRPARAQLASGEVAGQSRFPAVGVSYPLGSNVFSLQFSGYLDQEFTVISDGTIVLDGVPVGYTDQFVSIGGIGRTYLGWARPLGSRFAVGLSVGRYVGSLERSLFRTLDSEDLGTDAQLFATSSRWSASGPIVGGGVNWNVSSLLRVGASAFWSGDLELTPAGGQATEGRTYTMPVEVRAGGTFTVVPGTTLSVGGTFADWGPTGDDLTEGNSRGATWSLGAGVEFSGGELFGRRMPVRLGARQAQLPFTNEGAAATERMFAAGLGLHLAEVNDLTLALLEVGFERGRRVGGDLSEDFFRTTLTLRIAGN